MSKGRVVLGVYEASIARGSRFIYEDFSLEFTVGVTVLLGPNGTGKTTLLETLADPSGTASGSIELNGNVFSRFDRSRSYYRQTSFLPQRWMAVGGMVTLDVLAYAAWLKGAKNSDARASAHRVLEQFELSAHAKVPVQKLSGGVRQRVAIAEAFVSDPQVAILDEPTVGLDPQQRSVIRGSLSHFSEERCILLSTHLTDDAALIADRIVVLQEGQVLFDGTPDALEQRGAVHAGRETGIEAGYLAVMQAASG